jgi:enamine deaminase RidA (YjgF/YER057c/UK114 family)
VRHALDVAIEKINPDSLVKAHGYTHVTVGTGTKFVFTSGQVPLDADENLVGDGPDYRAQGYQAARNVYAALAAAGARPTDMVRMTIYVVGPSEANLQELYGGLGRAAREVGAKATATTLVGVAAIAVEGATVEIEATALIE